MKKLVLSLALVLGATFAFGQELTKEQLKEQKKQIKALMKVAETAEANINNDPVGAANAMKTVVKNPLVNKDAYVWFVSASAKKAVIDEENRKRAEGADFDEAKLYSYAHDFGKDLKKCDECDQIPDKKGRVKPRYKEFVNMSYAQQYGQFYNAGAYYYGNEEYEKAYDLFGMFIYAADKLYKEGMMGQDTINTPVAAYNMALCGMQMEDYEKVLSHVDKAMVNKQMAPSAFRYKTVATVELGDTAKWIELCLEGVKSYPEDAYFSQSLIQYYDNRGENDKLNELADKLIAADPENPLFLFLKGYIAQGRFEREGDKANPADLDTAIEWYKKSIEVDGNYETSLSNLGRCYLQKAQILNNEQPNTRDKKVLAKFKETLNGYFKEALPLYERLREIKPDRTDLWMNGLMNCYYNLNMSKELKALEKLQESMGY
jgi:tetratricopeptide (TPR) repeat protein